MRAFILLFYCGKFGHKDDVCANNKVASESEEGRDMAAPAEEEEPRIQPEVTEPYASWMLVKRPK